MLKFEVDSLEGIDESLHDFYEQHDDKFRLKVDGIDPADELKEALRKEREERAARQKRIEELEAKHQEAEEAARKAAEEQARKSGNVEALEKSWQEKYSRREGELTAQLEEERNTLQSQIKALTVGRTATDLAAELAIQGSAKALLPHLERRLGMDVRDGQPVVVVLDADGNPSAATLDELKAEFANDPAFAPLIVGSKASGGGAGGAKGGGAANLKRAQMTAEQKREYISKHGQEAYLRLPKD